MFSNQTTVIQSTLAHDSYGRYDITQIRTQSAQAFWKMYARGIWRSFVARLKGRSTRLQALPAAVKGQAIASRRFAGNQTVSIADIAGSEGRTTDFDNAFRPLQTHNQDRWVNLLTAWRSDVVLPPVELVEVNGRYYVRDGHHRISVASWLGQTEIDARVTVWATR